MAKKVTPKAKVSKSILNAKSLEFLKAYLNNASPTGFESEGQKLWLDYIKPYTDDYFTDIYFLQLNKPFQSMSSYDFY